MGETHLGKFKHNEEKSLTLFFIDNYAIIHPEILAVVEHTLEKYKVCINEVDLFLKRLNEVGLEPSPKPETCWAFSNLVGIQTEKDDLYGRSFDKTIFYLLLEPHLGAYGLKIVSGIKMWNNLDNYDFMLSIHNINDALLKGLDAWVDAIYLYQYNLIKNLSCTLAKSPTSTLVTMEGFKNKDKIFMPSDQMYSQLFQSLASTDIDVFKRHRFNTRLDAIASKKRLDNTLTKLRLKATCLEMKYNLRTEG